MDICTVIATRQGKWWAIDVPDYPMVHTQAAHWGEVEATAREAIALHLDLDETVVEVDVELSIPGQSSDPLRRLAEARRNAAEAQAAAHRTAVETARLLTQDAGIPLREAGSMMGLAHQRVHQLLQEA